MSWWPFALFAFVSLVAIDVVDSDRGIVVVCAYLMLVAGAVSATVAFVRFRRH